MTLRHKPALGALTAVLLTALCLPAFGQDLMALRVTSLDAAFADAQTVARAVGADLDRDAVMGQALGMLGLSDASFLDWKRPAVAVLPMAGMMLQQKGFVVALPVTDGAAAVEAVAGAFAGHEDQEGLHVFSTEVGPMLFGRMSGGHLVLGGTRELVGQFDPAGALSPGDGPPGNLSMELFLEPVAPMLQMGLMTAKQQIATQMESQGAGEEMPFDPKALTGVIDLYMGLVQNMLNNVSRLQISLEMAGEHVIWHERFVPKAGSTLAGLVAAQKAGMPSVARMVDPGAAVVFAGNVEHTPEFQTALKEFVSGYMKAMAPIIDGVLIEAGVGAGPEGGAEGEAKPSFVQTMLPAVLENMEQTLDCYGSGSAGSFDLAPGGGLSGMQIYDWKDSDACRQLPAKDRELFDRILAEFPQMGEFVSFSSTDAAGASTFGLSIKMSSIFDAMGEMDEGAREMVTGIYGESLDMRWTYAAGKMLMVMGKDAEKRLAGLTSGGTGGGGLNAATFAPLKAGTGAHVRIDVGRLAGAIRTMLPEEADDEARQLLAKMEQAFSGSTGRIPLGLSFDGSGATFQAAVPLALIEAVSDMVHQGGEEHGHDHGHDHGGHSSEG